MLRLRPCGEQAVLAEVDPAQVHRFAAAARRLPNVVDVVPGACTVLVVGADPAAVGAIELPPPQPTTSTTVIEPPPPQPTTSTTVIELPVVYDGADLDVVAARTGYGVEEVVSRHAAGVYTVEFLGFAPGFGYLSGLDPLLRVPRRATPRTRVPAGAVAIADQWTCVYPMAMPGGWQLLGHTDVRLFDPADEAHPARLTPGDQVRFRPA